MKHNYTIIIEPLSQDDGGGFLGRVPDLKGCMSDGETRAEALKNTEQAIAEWIEETISLGRNVPEPQFILKAA